MNGTMKALVAHAPGDFRLEKVDIPTAFAGELIVKGGVVMIPIVLCSILSLAVIIERAFSLHRAQVDTETFFKKAEDLIIYQN